MNWYTAFSWCASQGMQLQTIEQICGPEWNGNIGMGNCPYLVDMGNTANFLGWSATPLGTTTAFFVRIKLAGVGYDSRAWDYSAFFAMCR